MPDTNDPLMNRSPAAPVPPPVAPPRRTPGSPPIPPPPPSAPPPRSAASASQAPKSFLSHPPRSESTAAQPVGPPLTPPKLPDSPAVRSRGGSNPRTVHPQTVTPRSGNARPGGRKAHRRRVPSWLLSLVTHVFLLLILAIIPLRDLAQGPLTFILGPSGPESTSSFELGSIESFDLAPEEAEDLPELSPPVSLSELMSTERVELLTTPVPADGLSQQAMLPNLSQSVARALSGRVGNNKAQLLARFGGTQETEDAVAMGLAWLAEQQKSDGSWSLKGPYSKGGANENKAAATAMALNAFLGAGYTHQPGNPYSSHVQLGLKYLLRRQNAEGLFAEREPPRQVMYAQALASICVIEAYGMTGDSELRIAADRAIRFAEWSQNPQLRGWRYDPREDADLSVTGWFLMALETGKMAGLGVDESIVQGVSSFLDVVSHEDRSRYGYTKLEPPSLGMTAVGLLCRILLGWPKSHPALVQGIQLDLLSAVPQQDQPEYSVYYWYYATQVVHHVGGQAWEEWNAAMRQVLPATQIKQGDEAGSWDPSMDIYGASGGRLYTTCFHIYCLEVYYRHLSLYDIR